VIEDERKEQARFLAQYAKHHSAGAFATPTWKDLMSAVVVDLRDGAERYVEVVRRLSRVSRRTDWTGRPFWLPAGALLATHVARTAGAAVPTMKHLDYVFTYREDEYLTKVLEHQGREVVATRISAASEIICCWGRAGEGRPERPVDLVTLVPVWSPVQPQWRAPVLKEVGALTGWHDDYPFYSDGSWSALSLRGFRPDDPTWGVKPAEMSRAWKAEHPEALGYTCEWTTLARECPALVALVQEFTWGWEVERVRILRMAGTGHGRLDRHTDITDKAAGPGDGHVVRFHLPLLTDPKVEMHAWDLEGHQHRAHLGAWRWWYLDARKPHAVVNPTRTDRIHLTVDVVSNAEVREQLVA
jgi:hypothetical protein